MAKIFISHSKQDKGIKSFFLEAFAGTYVKPHLEELEKPVPTGVTAAKIEKDIFQSNALFVLLSANVTQLKHTRDWITWECGRAANKHVWVFEPVETVGNVDVVIPKIDHYVVYEQTEVWREEIRSLIDTVDDSHILPLVATGASTGAIISQKDRGTGAFVGALAGLAAAMLKDAATPPKGIMISCAQCGSVYKVYSFGDLRCPVCNWRYRLSHATAPLSAESVADLVRSLPRSTSEPYR